ncbi:MAG: caspase family protein [Alphaproteobacteria bacterium]
MRRWTWLLGAVLALALAGEATPAAAQGNSLLRSQTNRTTDAIQNQIRQAVRPRLAVRNPAGAVESLTLSRDGRLLAVVFQDNSIRLFDLQAGVQRARLAGGAARLRAAAVSGDGRFVLGGSDDGTVAVWDAATGNKLRELRGHSGAVNAIASAGDGSFAATAGADGTVRLWVPESGQALPVLRGHAGAVLALAVSPDNRTILSGGTDGKAILWNRADGRAMATLDGQGGKLVAVGFDSAGRGVTTDESGAVRVWAPNGTTVAQTYRGGLQGAGAQVTPDGRYVVQGNAEGKARLQEVDSGRVVKEFAAPSGAARYVLVDVQRQRLVMGGADGMVRVLNLGSGANLAEIVATLSGWAVLDTQGRFDGSQQGVDDVAWIANQATLPIDNFSQKYYEPGLLAKHFAERPGFVSEAATVVSDGIFLPPQSTVAVSPGPYQPAQSVEVTIASEDRGGGIGAVRLFHNGKLVPRDLLASERTETRNNNSVRQSVYRVALVTGSNAFEVVAASEQGIDGVPATVVAATPGTRPLPALHVVTIGINKYRDSRLNLDYGAPDALAILAALNRSSGAVFSKVIEYRLINEAASRQSILELLKGLRAARAEDEVVIFYAGHGEIFGKEWYLLPYDANLASEADVAHSSISADELRDAIVHIGAERILMFVDACKSGGGVDTIASALDRKVLREVAREAGVAVLAASRRDQLAAELPSLGHGAFTYVVLQGLAGRADRDPADGQITVSKILRYSLEALPTVTQKFGTLPQVPVAYRRGSDFVVKSGVGG